MVEVAKPQNVTDTPAFREAVATEVQKVLSLMNKVDTPPSSGDANFVKELAMTLAQFVDQDNHIKRIDPSELSARSAARDSMITAILKARTNKTVPIYKVTEEIYLETKSKGGVRILPWTEDPISRRLRPNVLEWDGIPNESMAPLNEVAREISGYFLRSIGVLSTKNSNASELIGGTFQFTNVEGVTRRNVGNGQDAALIEALDDVEESGIGSHTNPNAKRICILGSVMHPVTMDTAELQNTVRA